jgi:rfaE bifunctional protein nucleotidyltransferase chain/domain
MKIISSFKELKKKSDFLKKNNKKIILVHGVFDLVHPGHLSYFKEAKTYGDILVVSITADKYVNKGINKPYFKQSYRLDFLSSLEIVDYVFCNNSSSAVNVIQNLKPKFYIKGPDYKVAKNDTAGNLKKEKNAVENIGGKLVYTSGTTFSSSSLMNSKFEDYNPAKQIISKYFKSHDEIKLNFNDILNKISKDKILVLGEIIIDKYIYAEPLGKPSKEDILSVCINKSESFLGGVIPVIKNIKQFNKNVSLISIYNNENIKKKIKTELGNLKNMKLIKVPGYKDVIKSRFVSNGTTKIFETYEFSNKKISNLLQTRIIKKFLENYDHVIVCDFGHGLIDNNLAEEICKKSKFLSLNVQTNSGNRGFNLFTKYKKADLLCIDRHEIKLGLSDKFSSMNELINDKRLEKFKNIVLTMGSDGHILKNFKNKNTFEFPAMNKKVVDTIGAGDAFYSYLASFIKHSSNPAILSLAGSIAGALKTNILGHKSEVKIENVLKSLIFLTK